MRSGCRAAARRYQWLSISTTSALSSSRSENGFTFSSRSNPPGSFAPGGGDRSSRRRVGERHEVQAGACQAELSVIERRRDRQKRTFDSPLGHPRDGGLACRDLCAGQQPASRLPDDIRRGIAPPDKGAQCIDEQACVDPAGERAKHLVLGEIEERGRAQIGRQGVERQCSCTRAREAAREARSSGRVGSGGSSIRRTPSSSDSPGALPREAYGARPAPPPCTTEPES